jgi:hypothetical protein
MVSRGLGQQSAVVTGAGPLAQMLPLERDSGVLSLPCTAGALDRIRAIVHELDREPGLTALQVADRAGLTRRQSVLLLLRLEEHGLVLHEGRRWFPGAQALH